VFEWGDRVTLLARGRTVLESPVGETSRDAVAGLLLGSAQGAGRAAPARAETRPDHGGPVLRLDDFGPRGAPTLTLDVPSGSLVTLLAIDGNGADEIAVAIAGLAPSRGTLEVAGKRVSPSDPRAFRAAGGAFVPGDRRREGVVASFTLAENLALRRSSGLRLDRAAARAFADAQIASFGIRASGPDALAGELSGGNQQKLVLARELADAPRLLLAVHPTRGLDLAASAEIRARIVDVTAAGGAALVVTADPDEAVELAGPIRVVYRGRVSDPLPPTTPFEVLGRLMGGLAA
jgi:simple sugar transport system ATP-binding protein